jgi:hypothetical protein
MINDKNAGRRFWFVSPEGVEPSSKAPQAFTLSIKLWGLCLKISHNLSKINLTSANLVCNLK